MKYLFSILITAGLLISNLNFASAQDDAGWVEEPAAEQEPVAQSASRPVIVPIEQSNDAVVSGTDPKNLAEKPGVGYHSVGARFRWIFIPKWFVTMFGVDAQAKNMKSPMISNIGLGLEYTYRKDNFDITAAIWGVGLGWDGDISFKGSGEPPQSWEVVTNDLGAVLFTADFIWSSPIRDWVAITYGVGLGMGIPTGKIVKTEAMVDYPNTGLEPCDGPGGDSGCDSGGSYNETYDNIKVVPWINLLVGARFKPHEHLAIYVDGGFGLGFQMGVRAGYIF